MTFFSSLMLHVHKKSEFIKKINSWPFLSIHQRLLLLNNALCAYCKSTVYMKNTHLLLLSDGYRLRVADDLLRLTFSSFQLQTKTPLRLRVWPVVPGVRVGQAVWRANHKRTFPDGTQWTLCQVNQEHWLLSVCVRVCVRVTCSKNNLLLHITVERRSVLSEWIQPVRA